MSFQKTIEESIQQLQAWIRFLETERARLQEEIRRIRETSDNPDREARQPEIQATTPAPEEDEWL